MGRSPSRLSRRFRRRIILPVVSAAAATAATMLAMIAFGPEPEVQVRHQVRVVTVPAERPADQGRQREPSPGTRVQQRVADWEPSGFRPGTPDLQVVDRLLRSGADPWKQPDRGGVELVEPATPVPYRQWLNTLLEDQASVDPSSAWPDGLVGRGAAL